MTEPDFLLATRAGYDAIAEEYTDFVRGDLERKPWDRAMLAVFAELVGAGSAGPVADVGCGTGRVTAHLHGLGVDAFGVDLSPGMIDVARRTYPGLRFDVGSMLALDLPDGGLGGLLAWYSTIHVPDDRLPEVFAEFHRVLAPGGHVLLAFQVGDEALHLTEGLGQVFSLIFQRRRPEDVSALLVRAGFAVCAQTVRESDGTERTPQAYLVARKPPASPEG
ncbi:Methyltransferase domain-containing protein [Sinosporangium album]|uniref:Methyltransferase domain-containing protein n=1 Tax=Sinosporangium album TaxID=504805 RepID=A0A1G8CNN7_9ACTN|nr:class I SAM-dependent methyltransferase [Sinosporangium album]SDH47118.1 Methyltransferase domain-containing protein [Sinosporangium album]